MLKKFFAGIFLATVIFFGGQNHFAEAQDVYVGTSNATGWDCYIMTETMHDINSNSFEVTLKMVTQSKNVKYLQYTFWRDSYDSDWYFINSQEYSGKVSSETPIEWNILRAFRGSPKAY